MSEFKVSRIEASDIPRVHLPPPPQVQTVRAEPALPEIGPATGTSGVQSAQERIAVFARDEFVAQAALEAVQTPSPATIWLPVDLDVIARTERALPAEDTVPILRGSSSSPAARSDAGTIRPNPPSVPANQLLEIGGESRMGTDR